MKYICQMILGVCSMLLIASVLQAQHLRIFACAIANDSAGAFMGGSSNGSGLYQSDDTGKTWKHLGWQNIKCYSMDMVQSSNGRILYEATGLGVLRSTNYGEHWKQITDWRISEVMDVAVNQKNPEEIYIATAHGAFRTQNEGRTWDRLHASHDNFVRGIHENYNDHVFLSEWESWIQEDTIQRKFEISELDEGFGLPRLDMVWCSAWDPIMIGDYMETRHSRSNITGGPRGLEEGFSSDNDSTHFVVDTAIRNVTSLLFAGENLLMGSLDSGVLMTQLFDDTWIRGKKEVVLPHRQIWTLKSFTVTP